MADQGRAEEVAVESPPRCPECGAAVYYDLTCHTWPKRRDDGSEQWMSCLPCDSATEYVCTSVDCRWRYTLGLNPGNPRSAENEAGRPPWMDDADLRQTVPSVRDVEWPDD